ncbi:MAG: HIT family hydrolase [Chloroflexi bacterium]|nr:HIT family hydrolase [Chloroflexota bacterium]
MKTEDFLGNVWDVECMGCAINSQSMLAPGGLIKRTHNFCIHQDPLIPIPGFLVIASVRHIRSISDMHDIEYDEFAKLVKTTHHAIKKVTTTKSLTIVQEERSNHFHLWFFPWTQSVIKQYGQPSLTKIREIMVDYQGQQISKSKWAALEKTISKIRTFIQ